MKNVPDTRVSLILRLPNAKDASAWQEFIHIYEPFIYRFARRRGLQDADAWELTQEVFLGVANAIGDWEPDQKRAQFRTWLFRIARNQVINQLTRRKSVQSIDQEILDQDSANGDDELQREEERQFRLELLRWSANRVRHEVSEQSWEVFRLTAFEGYSAESVARELGITRAHVYVAKGRVIHRLRQIIARFDEDQLS